MLTVSGKARQQNASTLCDPSFSTRTIDLADGHSHNKNLTGLPKSCKPNTFHSTAPIANIQLVYQMCSKYSQAGETRHSPSP